MAIVMRTVIGVDESEFRAFVNDGTLVEGDELFSGTFRRTETWVNVRSPGRSVSTTVYEPVGELTCVGVHRQSDDPSESQTDSGLVVQQMII